MLSKIVPADINPTVMNWIVTGLMALTFIVLAKWAVNRWPIKGLTEVVNMA